MKCGQGVEVAGGDEVVDRGEVVVDGKDDDAAGLEQAVNFGEARGGVGADGDDIAHGGDELEVVRGEARRSTASACWTVALAALLGEIGLGGPFGELFADFLEHVGGEVRRKWWG